MHLHRLVLSVICLLLLNLSFIHKASAHTEHVCSNQTIPTGHAVTAILGVNAACTPYAQYKVDSIIENLRICSVRGIPAGKVVTNVERNARGCNSGPAYYDAYTIKTPASGDSICHLTRVPNGFIATSAAVDVSRCDSFHRMSIRIPSTADVDCAVDGLNAMPTNFVATSLGTHWVCDSYARRSIVKPTPPTSLWMCAISPVPASYNVEKTQAGTSACKLGYASYNAYFIEPVSGIQPTASITVTELTKRSGFAGWFWGGSVQASSTFTAATTLTYRWVMSTGQSYAKVNDPTQNFTFRDGTRMQVTLTVSDGNLTTAPVSIYLPTSKNARPGVQDMPWGTRDMAISDPFGNKLVFNEEPST